MSLAGSLTSSFSTPSFPPCGQPNHNRYLDPTDTRPGSTSMSPRFAATVLCAYANEPSPGEAANCAFVSLAVRGANGWVGPALPALVTTREVPKGCELLVRYNPRNDTRHDTVQGGRGKGKGKGKGKQRESSGFANQDRPALPLPAVCR